jgi:hypothetical protein
MLVLMKYAFPTDPAHGPVLIALKLSLQTNVTLLLAIRQRDAFKHQSTLPYNAQEVMRALSPNATTILDARLNRFYLYASPQKGTFAPLLFAIIIRIQLNKELPAVYLHQLSATELITHLVI